MRQAGDGNTQSPGGTIRAGLTEADTDRSHWPAVEGGWLKVRDQIPRKLPFLRKKMNLLKAT